MRVDDSIYQMIKAAADGQKRNISNFIEFATLQYLTSVQYVENSEMNEILNDKELVVIRDLEVTQNQDFTMPHS